MDENIRCTIEALILSSPEPVSTQRICEVLDEISMREVREAIEELNNLYMGCGNSFRIREIAGGYQMYILPDFEGPIKRLIEKQRTVRLTRAALETLAIVAYKQPVTKSEIEHIRGVASDGVLHNLLQRDLILIAGRADAPGRPLLYKTSKEFLKFFGLNRLADLPDMEEIEEMIRQSHPSEDETAFEYTLRTGTAQTASGDNGDEDRIAAEKTEPDDEIDEPDQKRVAFPENPLDEDSGNGGGGDGDSQEYVILDDYEPIPGDPIPDLEKLREHNPTENRGQETAAKEPPDENSSSS